MGCIRRFFGLLWGFDFALFDELFLFFLYAFKKNRSRLVVRVLRNEFAMDGKIQYFLP